MITKIQINDVGTFSTVEHDSGTDKLTVIHSGGCDVERLLRTVDFEQDLQPLANEILGEWQDGYEGDPAEAGLRVAVQRDFATATATA
jgi:hypothetical protein